MFIFVVGNCLPWSSYLPCRIVNIQRKAIVVTNICTPTSAKQLLRALGLLGWFCRFTFQFGGLAAPLYHLTAKEIEFVWTKVCDKAFNELKNRLISAPVLKLPDFNGPEFLLQVDASGMELAVLFYMRIMKGFYNQFALSPQNWVSMQTRGTSASEKLMPFVGVF